MSMPRHYQPRRARSDWSDREIDTLKKLWVSVDQIRVIIQRLKKPNRVVHAKARELGLGPFEGNRGHSYSAPEMTMAEMRKRIARRAACMHHRMAIRRKFGEPVELVAPASPIGPPIRRIVPEMAALIDKYLERRTRHAR